MGPRGIIFEPGGSPKWVLPMSVGRSELISELPGVIWGAFCCHFGELLGRFFGIFSRCVFYVVFGHFGHRFLD